MAKYIFTTYSTFTHLTEHLTQDQREKFQFIITETKLVPKTSHQPALDSADTASRSMVTPVVMRTASWLQSLGLPGEVQNMVEDLPFEGPKVFSEHKDFSLQSNPGSLRIYVPQWKDYFVEYKLLKYLGHSYAISTPSPGLRSPSGDESNSKNEDCSSLLLLSQTFLLRSSLTLQMRAAINQFPAVSPLLWRLTIPQKFVQKGYYLTHFVSLQVSHQS